jgi:uncharacterized membrane protein YbhN (UPF0104 family)
MSLTRQDWRKILPGIAVSLLALAVIFYWVDFQRLGQALQLADYGYIALLFLISLVWIGVRGLVWRALLQEQASYSQVFLTLNEGYLLNNLLPFRLGEVGRAAAGRGRRARRLAGRGLVARAGVERGGRRSRRPG